ncbi:MAG TPA: hypothetical protein VIL94_08930 [Acidothermaceae bacterium]|jgi:small-conductance mechanosensitive channel
MTTLVAGTKIKTAKRLLGTGFVVVLGGAETVGAWAGGHHGLAVGIGAFYVIASLGVYVWSGRRGDVAALLRADGDERQRQLDMRATAIAGLVMIVCCIAGAVVNLAHGGSGGPWAVLAAVGGLAYAVALAGLRHREHSD